MPAKKMTLLGFLKKVLEMMTQHQFEMIIKANFQSNQIKFEYSSLISMNASNEVIIKELYKISQRIVGYSSNDSSSIKYMLKCVKSMTNAQLNITDDDDMKSIPISIIKDHTLNDITTPIGKDLNTHNNNIKQARALRNKWLYIDHKLAINYEETVKIVNDYGDNKLKFKCIQCDIKFDDGIMYIFQIDTEKDIFCLNEFSFDAYKRDLQTIMEMQENTSMQQFCNERLNILKDKFEEHQQHKLNDEMEEMKYHDMDDIYGIIKVDNHVHHTASFNQLQFIQYIKKIYKRDGDKNVTINDKQTTIKDLFSSLRINVNKLNVTKLNMHAYFGSGVFNRFQHFKGKFNPMGKQEIRQLLLRYSGHNNGKYLAELTREHFEHLSVIEETYNSYHEYRISINGKDRNEWTKLAKWIIDNQLYHPRVRWLVQIPRKYDVNKKKGYVENFHEMLENIFVPLFEATRNPNKNKELYIFMQMLAGFDCVDDESVDETKWNNDDITPNKWNGNENPKYTMYMYYLYINIRKLNMFRGNHGLNTYTLRPHSGECGESMSHLASCFMVSDSINHGIKLKDYTVLQYLYYIEQIGLSVSPLSNNKLFKRQYKNPFPDFLRTGLNVTLSTDDPLIFHLQQHPLFEEYASAMNAYQLTPVDISEIGRNSMIQSSLDFKTTDTNKNIPKIRLGFRIKTLNQEKEYLNT